MASPLWVHGETKRDREYLRKKRRKSRARFVVEYDLAYDGGGSRWDGYYRTYFGARAAAFWNTHISSWGGSAKLYTYPKPTPPPTVGPKGRAGASKKGIFRGRK